MKTIAFRQLPLLALAAGACLLRAHPAAACLSGYEDGPPPAPPVYLSPGQQLMSHEDRGTWTLRIADMRKQAEGGWNFMTQTKLGVCLAHAGQYDEAVNIFQNLERIQPGGYTTAENLGTMYELKGNNAAALYWIKEGMRRNAQTHEGTEWLHVRILEAKLKLAQDPNWLRSHSVAGLDTGAGRTPNLPHDAPGVFPEDNMGQRADTGQVSLALAYQLRERLEFVPKPDPVVSDLLFDFANMKALNAGDSDDKPVAELYQMALDYGPAKAALVWKRFKYYNGAPNYWLQGALWLAVFATLWGLYKRYEYLFEPVVHTIPEEWGGPPKTYGVSDRTGAGKRKQP